MFIGEETLAAGDYSGPAGARLVMRDRRTEAAILEAARGGILRRGLAVSHADVALVTNISSDHFGEYGIDDLAGLADVKLSVAAALAGRGRLVLNADDALLRMKARELAPRYGRRADARLVCPRCGSTVLARVSAHRAPPTCGVRAGRLCAAATRDLEQDLGAVDGDAPVDRRHRGVQRGQSRRGRAGGGLARIPADTIAVGVRALRRNSRRTTPAA